MRILKIYWAWVTFITLLLGVPQYLAYIGIGPKPKIYIYIWFASALVLFTHGTNTRRFVHNRLVIWSVVYFCISVLWMPMAWNSYVAIEFTYVILTLILTITSCVVLPQMRLGTVRGILWCCLFAGVASIIYDIMNPGVMLENAIVPDGSVNISGRAAGFYLNPNNAGMAILFLSLCLVFLSSKRLALLAISVAFIGILLTFSRSSMLSWVIAVALLVYSNRLPARTGPVVFILMAAFFVTGEVINSYLYRELQGGEIDWTNSLDRVNFFATGDAQGDASAESRVNVTQWAIDEILQPPFLGGGLGYSQEWTVSNPDLVNTHNLMLKYGLDFGIIGLFIFPYMIIATSYVNNNKSAIKESMVVIVVTLFLSLFSHNLMEQQFFILPMCILNHYFFYWRYEIEEDRRLADLDVSA